MDSKAADSLRACGRSTEGSAASTEGAALVKSFFSDSVGIFFVQPFFSP